MNARLALVVLGAMLLSGCVVPPWHHHDKREHYEGDVRDRDRHDDHRRGDRDDDRRRGDRDDDDRDRDRDRYRQYN